MSDELSEALEMCINARSVENGYADKHGMPSPERKERP